MMGALDAHRLDRRCGGFTLIELLVVLALLAGLSVVAYAALIPGYGRVREAYQRDDLERQLRELPQRVRISGYGGILTSRSGEALPDGAAVMVEGVSQAQKSVEDWHVLRLSLPDGWTMRVAAPIFYHFSGSCEGGEVIFRSPSAALRYQLRAPLCRPIRDAVDRS